MSKNIYKKIGFKEAKEFVYLSSVINEAKDIFESLPRIVGIRPLIIAQTMLEETLAISTAEDSELSIKTAEGIRISQEQEARILKYKNNAELDQYEKYDQLEFENIRAVENQINDLSFNEIDIELICNLHHDLTIGLDEYSKKKGVSYYHSGKLRQSDSTKVGKIRRYEPPSHKDIKDLLNTLFNDFAERETIQLYDILEFHILLYAIHPFQNGNKRVARILESMLLAHYGYSIGHTISLAIYYSDKKDATNQFIMESLTKRNVLPFINFGIRGYFYAGNRLFHKTLEIQLKNIRSNIEKYAEQQVKPLHQKRYKDAAKTIVELRGVFTHTEFVNQMKKKAYTIGRSQTLIKDLLDRKIIKKKEDTYYVGESLMIYETTKKLLEFFIQNNIEISQ